MCVCMSFWIVCCMLHSLAHCTDILSTSHVHVHMDMSSFLMGFKMACLDYAMDRLLLCTMAHTIKDYTFLPRVVNTLFSYIEEEIGDRPITHLFNNSQQTSKL